MRNKSILHHVLLKKSIPVTISDRYLILTDKNIIIIERLNTCSIDYIGFVYAQK